MASPVDDMILDNDNSRDGGSVASATPAPTPAQTPSPPMPNADGGVQAQDVRVLERA